MTSDEMRKIRDRLGMNIRDFADAIGANKGSVSNYETGKRHIPKSMAQSAMFVELMTRVKPNGR